MAERLSSLRQWTRNALRARHNQRLQAPVRRFHGKGGQSTAARPDRQADLASAHGGAVGHHAAEKTKGRQRFLLVDTLGLLLGVTLEPANGPDPQKARSLLATVWADYAQLRKLWEDGGGNGSGPPGADTCFRITSLGQAPSNCPRNRKIAGEGPKAA